MKTLTIICPVFNEDAVIQEFYRELKTVLTALSGSYESTILFVVDQSTDRTADVIEKIAKADPSAKVLLLSSRFGHQMSLLAGIDHAHADAIVMMDCDLQHPPSLIPLLLRKFEEGYDIVFTLRQDNLETGAVKRFSARLFYGLVNQISHVPISEGAADFRLISRQVAVVFQKQIRERNQFLRGLFVWVGFRNTRVPYQCQQRGGGISKYSWGRLLQFAAQGMISFSKRPLQAAIYIGFGFASLGFLLALFTFVEYFRSRSFPPGWATLAIIIPILSGIQLIFLGIIGEYIGAIFDEVKQRPHYIIERKLNFDE
jgi:dolichol-phosphate mannosyltransferase